jgi:glycosyltransferase involved in cell wall biosynthesis
MMTDEIKIAFVQDALPFQGGAEKVLEAALEAFPSAPIYTLVYREAAFRGSAIAQHVIHPSFLNRLPGAQTHHRAFLPLMPLAIEQFDLRAYDVIVSFSYAVAHGVLPRPDQLHISYVHTPMRYAWQAYHEFNAKHSRLAAPLRWGLRAFLHSFRKWDFAAAARVDHFLTVSDWMARCIWRAYRRPADVLYPPADLSAFRPLAPRGEEYVTVSRLVAHKRVDLIVEAFNRLGLRLTVIGEGPELERLRRLAAPNVTLLGWQPREKLAEHLGSAKAFIHASEEDFGIAMVEAQAAGCPVIALNSGSAREIVQEGHNGVLFNEQTSQSLAEAVSLFAGGSWSFDADEIVRSAARFDRVRFIDEFTRIVHDDWQLFHQDGTFGSQKLTLPARFQARTEHEQVAHDQF